MVIDPNSNSKPSLLRVSSKEKFVNPSPTPFVCMISEELLEEAKAENLRRTNSSSSIVSMGINNIHCAKYNNTFYSHLSEH